MAMIGTTIKKKTLDKISKTVLVGASIVTMGISIFLFWNLADSDAIRWLYVIFGVIWELGFLMTVIRLRTELHQKHYWKAFLYFLAYLVFGLVSYLGGVGFNVATINHQAKVIEQVQTSKTAVQTTADDLQDKIDVLKKKRQVPQGEVDRWTKDLSLIKDEDPARTWKLNVYTKNQKEAQARVDAVQEEIDKLIEPKNEKQAEAKALPTAGISSNDIFMNMGSLFFGASADFMKSFIFGLMLLILQIVIIMNAPIIETKERLDLLDRKKLFEYIDVLFPPTKGRLLNDYQIAEKTGMSLKQCQDIRNYLVGMSFKDEPILNRGQGGTSTKYSKENFIKIVNFWIGQQYVNDEVK